MPYYEVIANQGSVFDNATQFYTEMPKNMGLICRLGRGTLIEGKSVLRKVPVHDIKAQWILIDAIIRVPNGDIGHTRALIGDGPAYILPSMVARIRGFPLEGHDE